jgi:hypothetical protein
MRNLNCGKSSSTMWTASVIFKKLSNVNIYPLDENSPNLVTLKRTPTQKAIKLQKLGRFRGIE